MAEERIGNSSIASLETDLTAFGGAMRAGFVEMHRRFDRLDAINREISAALARIEARLRTRRKS